MRVANNGIDMSQRRVAFSYSPRLSTTAAKPSLGPSTGGTAVTVTGNNFVDSQADYSCRFGSVGAVPARWLSATELECVSPPHVNVQSVQRIAVTAPAKIQEVQRVAISATRGSKLGGTFTLELDGVKSSPIAFDATAAAFKTQLPATWGGVPLANIQVSQDTDVPVSGGVTNMVWRVTFQQAQDVSTMIADALALTGHSSMVVVDTVLNGNADGVDLASVGFKLDVEGVEATVAAATTDTPAQRAQKVKDALQTIGKAVDVTSEIVTADANGDSGFVWLVTFLQAANPRHVGEVPSIGVQLTSPTGSDADLVSADVEDVVEGYGPVVPLEVSANGHDYTLNRVMYEYHEPILLGSLDPIAGPSAGGAA